MTTGRGRARRMTVQDSNPMSVLFVVCYLLISDKAVNLVLAYRLAMALGQKVVRQTFVITI